MSSPVPGAISWGIINEWAKHHSMSRAKHAMLDTVMQAMDNEYLKWWTTKHAPDTTTTKGKQLGAG
jgi:hypothetical protein